MKKLEIAIIGGGAGCAAFLHHFVDFISENYTSQIKIKIFERKRRLGPGFAYQGDCESLLLNRAAHTMSASGLDFSTFAAWLHWKGMHLKDIRQWAEQDLSSTYVTRPVFGRFLEEFVSETCASAMNKGLEIEAIHEEVESIHKNNDKNFIITGAAGREDVVNRVILAIGNTEPFDFYNLRTHQSYANNPYPLKNKVMSWKTANRICIIGSSLTSVDIVASLKAAGYQGKIDMVSRNGILSFVRGKQGEPYILRFLTTEMLNLIIKRHGGTLPLSAFLRLLRLELHSAGEDWRNIFSTPKHEKTKTILQTKLQKSCNVQPWQQVLAATNEVIEQVWNAFSKDSKRVVHKHFFRCWMSRRAPMPKANGELLLQMLEDKKLDVIACEPRFDISEEATIRGFFGSSKQQNYDFVINATGPNHWVRSKEDSPLVWKMLEDGYALEDEYGGVKVDFETASLIDAQGVPDQNFRVLGHLTIGTYFFVSSLEMIAKKAYRIAEQLISDIQAYHPIQQTEKGHTNPQEAAI